MIDKAKKEADAAAEEVAEKLVAVDQTFVDKDEILQGQRIDIEKMGI